MTSVFDTKNANKFFCEMCDFYCCKKSNFEKHILTRKHINTAKILTNTYKSNAENAENIDNFVCECGKEYKHRQSLYNHKKICNVEEKSTSLVVKEDTTDKDQLILMLVKQNAELVKETTDFKSMMMEVIKNGTHNTNTINTTNSHNKSYSKVSDKYNKLIIESMGGSGDNDAEKEDKIVRNIVNATTIDKKFELLNS